MAINADIYRNVVLPPSPLKTMQDLADARNAELLGRIRTEELSIRQQELRAAQKKAEQEAYDAQVKAGIEYHIGNNLNPDGTPNIEKTLPNIPPEYRLGAMTTLNKFSKDQADILNTRAEAGSRMEDIEKKHSEAVARLAVGADDLLKAGRPEDAASLIATAAISDQARGISTPEETTGVVGQLRQGVESQDPASLRRIIDQMLAANPQAAADARKAQREVTEKEQKIAGTEPIQPVQAAAITQAQQNAAETARHNRALEAAAAARLAQEKAAGTGAGGVKLSAGQETELAHMKDIEDFSGEALELGKKTGWAGTGGLWKGTVQQWFAKNLNVGSDQEVQLRNHINNIFGSIAKLRGGVAFSPAEWALIESYTPSINDSPLVLQWKLKGLQHVIRTGRKNLLSIAGGGGQVPTGDLTYNPDTDDLEEAEP